MSEGPIKREREAFSSPRASNTGASAIHARGAGGKGYCGRRSVAQVNVWDYVTCSDCLAARTADLEAENQNLRKDQR